VPLIIAFVSQKGGVGKTTLARALATFAVRTKLKTRLADLDVQQRSSVVWETVRARQQLEPAVDVQPYAAVSEAVSAARGGGIELLILDMPGRIGDGVSEATAHAHLLVQPTSPSSDDLHIALLVFLAIERIKVPRERLAFALCRVLSEAEEKYARSYVGSFGYNVLAGSIAEDITYREAMRAGRSIIETNYGELNGQVEALQVEILRRAEENVVKPPERRARKK